MTDELFKRFDEDGYVIVEDALKGDHLKRVQEAFHRVEEETKPAWLERIAKDQSRGSYGVGPDAHVVEPVIDRDDVFIDVLENPVTIAISERMQGPDMMMIDNALLAKPAGKVAHTRWHRDSKVWAHEEDMWCEEDREHWKQMRACETPFHKIKIFFFVNDVDYDTGPFSVVPGSHKWENQEIPRYEDLNDMPDYVRLTGPAGAAIVWNGCIWHTAMENTDNKSRDLLLYNYTHFGQRQYDECIPRGEFRERLIRERSPLCKQLLGIERMKR
ncbi:MAG: phytanoyl-CoA dioxygenase family protein, partial [Candidatus Latescibacteria bacterium]|nr:phytanoyl-CoA dioxygenase family protein [Candidatus Latescibacterota bacterium]